MNTRWIVYFLTLFSYGSIHSIRTMWSTTKKDLAKPPFNFTVSFLGIVDMLVLFVLAIGINILGPKVTKYGPKRCLLFGLFCNMILTTLISLCMALNVTSQFIYVLLFAIGVGFISGLGWPSALCLVSNHFSKEDGLALSAWNGTSQLGDLLALGTYYCVSQLNPNSPAYGYLLLSFYFFVLIFLDIKLLNEDTISTQSNNLNEQNEIRMDQFVVKQTIKQLEKNEIQMKENKDTTKQNENPPIIAENNDNNFMTASNIEYKPVNLITVWRLPGVALNVIAYGLVKSVNSFIVAWMVFYLVLIGIEKQAIIITILWTVSIFFGGLIHGKSNKKLNKKWFVAVLFISAGLFLLLEEMHLKIYKLEIILALIACGLFYGGPYNLMSTAIPIELSSQAEVARISNGKSSIISLMQGFGQLCCGFSLLLVPFFGVSNIHLVGAIYCLLSAVLLVFEVIRLAPRNVQNNIRQRSKEDIVNLS